jgi:hypothetical protein
MSISEGKILVSLGKRRNIDLKMKKSCSFLANRQRVCNLPNAL